MSAQAKEKIVAMEIEEEDTILAQVIDGDLTALSPSQRLRYYKMMCDRLGLNPHSRPFEYLLKRCRLTNTSKLTLYAKKDCTDQLRRINGISTSIVKETYDEEYQILTVWARAVDKEGRHEESCGAVCLTDYKGQPLKGEARANAIMTADTKARRRVTLCFCGLGILDETEVETIKDAVTLTENDVIKIQEKREECKPKITEEASKIQDEKITQQQATDLLELLALCDSTYRDNVLDLLKKRFGIVDINDLTLSLHNRVVNAAQKHLNDGV